MAIPINWYFGTSINQEIEDIISIIMPPIFGYITYFVPERNDTNGIDIILTNKLGKIILNIKLPFEKSFPNMEIISTEKTKTDRQTILATPSIILVPWLNIWKIFSLSPFPNNFENSGKNTWVNNFGMNIRTLIIAKTEE